MKGEEPLVLPFLIGDNIEVVLTSTRSSSLRKMRLTNALLYYVRKRRIPGRIDIGKHQLVVPVTNQMKAEAVTQLLKEHQNLIHLQSPYLNEEEEKYLHAIETEYEDNLREQELDKRKQLKMREDITIESHLNHLKTTKCWE